MTDDTSELRRRCNEVDKTLQTTGWECIEAEWILEREKIIALGKKAVEDGKTEQAAYIMAELVGFDKALKVPQIFRQDFATLLQTDRENKKEQDNA